MVSSRNKFPKKPYINASLILENSIFESSDIDARQTVFGGEEGRRKLISPRYFHFRFIRKNDTGLSRGHRKCSGKTFEKRFFQKHMQR
jgi:hypothetical protein